MFTFILFLFSIGFIWLAFDKDTPKTKVKAFRVLIKALCIFYAALIMLLSVENYRTNKAVEVLYDPNSNEFNVIQTKLRDQIHSSISKLSAIGNRFSVDIKAECSVRLSENEPKFTGNLYARSIGSIRGLLMDISKGRGLRAFFTVKTSYRYDCEIQSGSDKKVTNGHEYIFIRHSGGEYKINSGKEKDYVWHKV